MQRATAITTLPLRNRETFAAAAVSFGFFLGLILGLIIRPGPWEGVG